MLMRMTERLTDYREAWDGVALWATEGEGATAWEPVVLRVDRGAIERLEGRAGLSASGLAIAADRHAVALLAAAARKLPFTDRAETIRVSAEDIPD
ncbi:hypothetical protein [Zavarzinia sp. CC-PAN008]|uniref:hypothetical protein n=1 Tax=Zavarzinia sp. CC-PAN008 TaxID=3243332 RepID=UPI003F74221D